VRRLPAHDAGERAGNARPEARLEDADAVFELANVLVEAHKIHFADRGTLDRVRGVVDDVGGFQHERPILLRRGRELPCWPPERAQGITEPVVLDQRSVFEPES
jgi:hypothetical protein